MRKLFTLENVLHKKWVLKMKIKHLANLTLKMVNTEGVRLLKTFEIYEQNEMTDLFLSFVFNRSSGETK